MSGAEVGAIVLGAVALGLLSVLAARRARQSRRVDQLERRARHATALGPPPSPYEVSRAVKLLDPSAPTVTREEPARPRIDAERAYVFSESGVDDIAPSPLSRSRHNEKWALERSSHRSRLSPGSGGILIAVAAGLLVLILVGALLHHGTTPHSTTTTSTTVAVHVSTSGAASR